MRNIQCIVPASSVKQGVGRNYLIPSKPNETFPVVILEAMQLSLPIISTRYRGIPDMVKDGDNGILIEPQNIGQLKKAIEELVQNDQKRKNMGARSREIYLANFTLEKYISNFETAILNCLKK